MHGIGILAHIAGLWILSGLDGTGKYLVMAGVPILVVAFVRYPLGQESPLVLQVANVAGIAAGTAIRYLAYRQWVFPRASSPGQATTTSGMQ